MTTWTHQLRKVARRTHIADRTMNTHCFLFWHLSTHDHVSVPNARRTNFPRSGSELWDWFAKPGIGCPKQGRRPRCPVAALNPTKGFRVNAGAPKGEWQHRQPTILKWAGLFPTSKRLGPAYFRERPAPLPAALTGESSGFREFYFGPQGPPRVLSTLGRPRCRLQGNGIRAADWVSVAPNRCYGMASYRAVDNVRWLWAFVHCSRGQLPLVRESAPYATKTGTPTV